MDFPQLYMFSGGIVADLNQAGAIGEVPAHLRDAHYQGAKSLGHGVGYDYPHDHSGGWVDQQYLPTDQAEKRYYEPTHHGAEAQVAERLAERLEQYTEGGRK